MAVTNFLNTSPWVWPICFLTNQILPILALASTRPKSPIRRVTMLTIVLSAYKFSHTITNFAPIDYQFRAASMCFTCVFLLNNNDLLNLTGVSYEQHVAWKKSLVASKSDDRKIAEKMDDQTKPKFAEKPPVEHSLWERLKWSTGMLWNFRRVGTQHQISNINPFSADNPSYVPSRKKFLLRTTSMLVLSKYMLDLADYILAPSDQFLYLLTRPYLRFFPRLMEVSLFETMFRSVQVCGFWLRCGMGQYICYVFFALICVGLGIQDPEQWPPYFGFASETWSVRQFWGSVWHQSFRPFLTPNVDYFVFSILRFPRGHLVTRYTRLMLAFLISGLIHLAMEYQVGFVRGEAGSVNFFLLQSLGIMLEDGVQAVGQKYFPKMDWRVKRLIGYIWVAVFLLETTPVWFYSQRLHLRTRKGAIVTFPNLENGTSEFEAGSMFGDLGLRTNFSMLRGRVA